MGKIIGIDKVRFYHGGQYDVGFWTNGKVDVVEESQMKTYELSGNEAEDLEYMIMKWLKKRLKVKVNLT